MLRPNAETRKALKVFVASPGDVPEEREKVREILLQLRGRTRYKDHFVIETFLWDDPHNPTPLSFKEGPEDSLIHYGQKPDECHLLIGILRHRLGTPLPEETYGKNAFGERFTGTEWEIHHAMNSPDTRNEELFVFVSNDPFSLPRGLIEKEREERQDQFDAVERFLSTLRDENGVIEHSVTEYENLDDFETKVRAGIEEWLDRRSKPEGEAQTKSRNQRGRPEYATAFTDQLPTLSMAVDRVDDDLVCRLASLHPAPPMAQTTPWDSVAETVKEGNFDVLFNALFGDTRGFDRLVGLPRADSGNSLPAQKPIRLRVIAPEAGPAALPWHCLSHGNVPLGRHGWIVATVLRQEDETSGLLDVPIDNPLIVAPSNPELDVQGARHASLFQDTVRTLLTNTRQAVTWARSRRDLEYYLRQDPPDLLYIYAPVRNANRLILDEDGDPKGFVRIADLQALLRGLSPRPLVWLNLLVSGAFESEILHGLREYCRLLLVQIGRQATPEHSAQQALDWLERLSDTNSEPAALVSSSAAPDNRIWLLDRGIRLRLPDAQGRQYNRIRAALIRILLGREHEKNLVYGYVKGAPAGGFLSYAALGEAQACVHDFPAQIRQRLEQDLDDGIRVATSYIHTPIHHPPTPDSEPLRCLRRHLHIGADPVREALRNLMGFEPLDDETVVLAIPWLLDLEADVTQTELTDWMQAWYWAHMELLEEAIPERCVLLIGTCIQLDDQPSISAQTALDIANRALPESASRLRPIPFRQPLGRLEPVHLRDFYTRDPLGRNLVPAGKGTEVPRIADWVYRQTEGAFLDTVNTIYTEYKEGYLNYQKTYRPNP